MSNFNVTILGCGAATPTTRHMPTAQAVSYAGRIMLIDCAEGTQLQLRRFGLPFSRITDIFISHLHGDHFFGLPGLLSTMALHNVCGTVTVHTFADGARVLKTVMDLFCHDKNLDLQYNIIDPDAPGIIYDNKHFTVETFPLKHRVPCVGYIFREKPKLRHIDSESARFYGVPYYDMPLLREGHDWTRPDGTVVPNALLTRNANPSASYAYASDTAYSPAVAEAVRGVDVLYHEATYSEEHAYNAAPRGHSTARQAAQVASEAGVGRLVIGHFSKTVHDEKALAAEATDIFPNVVAANEGMVIELS